MAFACSASDAYVLNSVSPSSSVVTSGEDAASEIMMTLFGIVTDCAAAIVAPEVSGPTISCAPLLFTNLVTASTATAGVA